MKFGCVVALCLKLRFESSVISYGSKTTRALKKQPLEFESSVISYGSKTLKKYNKRSYSLRVV